MKASETDERQLTGLLNMLCKQRSRNGPELHRNFHPKHWKWTGNFLETTEFFHTAVSLYWKVPNICGII